MYSNQQTQRHALHKQLIDIENKPCSNPACQTPFYKREIHRIIPALGYIKDNARVRDFNCHHFIDHPNSKFRIGDLIRVNGRCPVRVDLERGRPRRIVAIRYDPQRQANYYTLGSNGKGLTADGQPLDGYRLYQFRSYMLKPYEPTPRRIIRHRKPYQYNLQSCDKQQSLSKDEANTTTLRDVRILTTGLNQI